MDKRSFLQGALGAGLMAIGGGARAQTQDPIRLGWLSSLTGPLSTVAIATNLGVQFAVDELNKSGGINGRKLELLTRDTTGDPARAVSFANQLIFQDKVHFILGPVNSGESLPAVPIVARSGTPQLLITALDELVDPVKFPRAFRIIFANEQYLRVNHNYALNVLKRRRIAMFGDTTGYGTATVKQSTELLASIGVKPVYTVFLDPNKTSVSDDMAKARDAGADILMPWSSSTGLLARLLNARGDMGWDVPVVGHAVIMSTAIKKLLNKPEYWEQTYAVGLKNTTYTADGKVPENTRQLREAVRPRLGGGPIDFTFWWIATGVDLVKMVEHSVRLAGSTDPAAIQKVLESTRNFKGYYGEYSFSPTQHNGLQDSDLVVNLANSFKDGCYQLAPQ